MGFNRNKNWDDVEVFSCNPLKDKKNKYERAKSTPPAYRFQPAINNNEASKRRSTCISYGDKFQKASTMISKCNELTPRQKKEVLTRSPRSACASTMEHVVTPRRFRCSPPKARNEMYTACSDITSGRSTPRGCVGFSTPRLLSKSPPKDRNEMYTACSDITSLSPRSGRSTPRTCAELMGKPRKYSCGSDAGSDKPRSGKSTPCGQSTPRACSSPCTRSRQTSPVCHRDTPICGRNGRVTPLDFKTGRVTPTSSARIDEASPRPTRCGRLSSLSARSPTCERPALSSPCGRSGHSSPCSRSGHSTPCARSGRSTPRAEETHRVRFMTTCLTSSDQILGLPSRKCSVQDSKDGCATPRCTSPVLPSPKCMTPRSLSVSPGSACDNTPLKPSCVISRKREIKDPGIERGKCIEMKEDKRIIRLAQERIERLESSLYRQREMVCSLKLQLTHDGPKDYTKIRQTLENLERTIKKLIVSKNLHLPESKEHKQTVEQIERLKAHCYLLETEKDRLKIQVRTLLETSKRRKEADSGAEDTTELCRLRKANEFLIDVLTSCQHNVDELKNVAGAHGDNLDSDCGDFGDMNEGCLQNGSELPLRLAKKIKNDIRNVKDALNCSMLKKDESGACCQSDLGRNSGVRMQKLRDEIKLINHELQLECDEKVQGCNNRRIRELEDEVECLKGKLEEKTSIISEMDCKVKAMEEEMRAERERWNSSAKMCSSELDDCSSSAYNIDDWDQLISMCEKGISSQSCIKQNTKSRFAEPIETRKCASNLDDQCEELENCRSSPLLKRYMGRLRSRSKPRISSCRSSIDDNCFLNEDEDCCLKELSQTSRDRRLEKEDVLRMLTSTNGGCNTIFSLVQGAVLSHHH